MDLATLVIVYFALEETPVSGVFSALLVGYFADVFSGESRGLTSGAMVVAFLIVRLLVARFAGARWMLVTTISLLGTLVVFVVRLIIAFAFGEQPVSWHGAAPALPALVIGALLFGYPAYRLLRWIDQRFLRREDDMSFPSLIPRR